MPGLFSGAASGYAQMARTAGLAGGLTGLVEGAQKAEDFLASRDRRKREAEESARRDEKAKRDAKLDEAKNKRDQEAHDEGKRRREELRKYEQEDRAQDQEDRAWELERRDQLEDFEQAERQHNVTRYTELFPDATPEQLEQFGGMDPRSQADTIDAMVMDRERRRQEILEQRKLQAGGAAIQRGTDLGWLDPELAPEYEERLALGDLDALDELRSIEHQYRHQVAVEHAKREYLGNVFGSETNPNGLLHRAMAKHDPQLQASIMGVMQQYLDGDLSRSQLNKEVIRFETVMSGTQGAMLDPFFGTEYEGQALELLDQAQLGPHMGGITPVEFSKRVLELHGKLDRGKAKSGDDLNAILGGGDVDPDEKPGDKLAVEDAAIDDALGSVATAIGKSGIGLLEDEDVMFVVETYERSGERGVKELVRKLNQGMRPLPSQQPEDTEESTRPREPDDM